MTNTVYRQMPAPRDLRPQQIPTPPGKAWMRKPQGEAKCLVQIPGDVCGGDGYGWNWYLHKGHQNSDYSQTLTKQCFTIQN